MFRRLNNLDSLKKKRRMQIMDDAGEPSECETKIPNHDSPEMIKTSKVGSSTEEVEQNDEKENTDPLESNHASESIVSNDESKDHFSQSDSVTNDMENGENESKTCDEEEESISKNEDSIQLIESDEEESRTGVDVQTENLKKVQENEEKHEKKETEEMKSKENDTLLQKVLVEDVGSDENADVQRSPQVTEENLYDDIESELKPHVVNAQVSVDQNKTQKKEMEPMEVVSGPEIEKTKEVTNNVEVKTEKIEEVAPPVVEKTSKRLRSPSPIPNDSQQNTSHTIVNPSKKLRLELENSYGRHDKLLRDYIEATNRSTNVENVMQNITLLETEIKSLDAMLRAKEDEWNNILHMKLVKEEIRLRLIRRKETLEMKLTDPAPLVEQQQPFSSSTPLANKSQSTFNAPLLQESLKGARNTSLQNISQSVSMLPLSTSTNVNSTAHAILQQRASMKGADLMKEKQTAAKIQR